MSENKGIRVFFALWPNHAMRNRLARAAQSMQIEKPARRVPDYNLHLTLHFIGNINRDELPCLQQQASKVRGRRFDVDIDVCGYFKRSKVAWLGCSEIPVALADLHLDLGRRLRHCGYRPEARRYNPHLTVARKVGRAPAQTKFEALRWKVDDFVLIESRAVENGVKYHVIDSYPLA